MKRLLFSLFVLFLSAGVVRAQETMSAYSPQATQVTNVAENFDSTSAANVPLFKSVPNDPPFLSSRRFSQTLDIESPALDAAPLSNVTTALALPMEMPEPSLPVPSPSPTPRWIYTERDDYRWQLFLGVSFERFRSSVYSASAVGTDTSLSYFLSDWLGVEGQVATFFAPEILEHEHIKLVNYGAGPRITWRRPRWEPWFHGIFGGTHALPQTALSGKNGLAIQVGGGADYRLAPRLSLRLELDYVRTHLFGQWQDNGQGDLGLVFHF
jgi:hypothetical protein